MRGLFPDYTPPEQRDTTSKDKVHARMREAVEYHLDKNCHRMNLLYYHNLDPSDIANHIFPEDHSVRLLFDEFGLDETQVWHWRALLDALADNFVEHRGRRYKLSNYQQYELSCDIYDVHKKYFSGAKARYQPLADALRSHSPYSERWRREKDPKFVQRITRLIQSIDTSGTIDDTFLQKAATRYRRSEPDPRFVFPDEDIAT